MNLSEKLTYCTTKIESYDIENNVSIGTGFFMYFNDDKESNRCQPVIITNKHVVKDAKRIVFSICKGDNDNNHLDTKKYTITLDDFRIVNHPSDNVDLCAISIATMHNIAYENDIHLFYGKIMSDLIITKDEIDKCSAIEDVIMIGYPIGLEDSYNNKPIIRKGITSTHIKFDYNGRKEFLIDIPCFPGSSGSPIFMYYESSYKIGNEVSLGTRCRLLGLLYGGFEYNNNQITTENISTNIKSSINIPINLGIVIKAERILELEKIMRNMK